MFLNFMTRSRVRTCSWLGTGELCRPTRDGGYRGMDLTCACVRFRAVKKRKKWTKRLGGHACSDRALGRFRTDEEPRSIVQSHTIERGVLGSICGRASRRSNWTRSIEGHARGVRKGAKACRPHAARFVSLPWDNARLPGGLPSRRRLQKAPPRSAHWETRPRGVLVCSMCHSRPQSHQVAPSLINNGGVVICRGASHCCWSRH